MQQIVHPFKLTNFYSSVHPMTMAISDCFPPRRTYELTMEQNPIHARMCGFGDKDRRPMDPPPIVRLTVREGDGTPVDLNVPGAVDISQCMVMAELFTVDQLQSCSLVANPATTTIIPATPEVRTIGDSTMSILHLAVPPPISTRNLTGSTGASGDLLKDLTGNYGIFFAFPDLSVRTDGMYTLKFSFVMLPESPLAPSPVLATVFSAPFEIFHAKRFPGMIKSTPLSKMLFDQGVRIPLRKETRVGRNRALVLSEPEAAKQDVDEIEDIEDMDGKEV